MSKDEFIKNQIDDRKMLFKKIESAFKKEGTNLIELFGSGTSGFRDEFSDIDVLIMISDSKIENLIPKLSNVYNSIAPVIVRHHSKSWSPVGGSADSVIHNTKNGLFIVDYYISNKSEVVEFDQNELKDNFLEKGFIKLNRQTNKNINDTHSLSGDIDLLLNLIFISTKIIARSKNENAFLNTLKRVHSDFRKRYPNKLKQRQIKLNYKSNFKLLSDLYKISNKRQKRAIYKIRSYMKQVEKLYQN